MPGGAAGKGKQQCEGGPSATAVPSRVHPECLPEFPGMLAAISRGKKRDGLSHRARAPASLQTQRRGRFLGKGRRGRAEGTSRDVVVDLTSPAWSNTS